MVKEVYSSLKYYTHPFWVKEIYNSRNFPFISNCGYYNAGWIGTNRVAINIFISKVLADFCCPKNLSLNPVYVL